MTQREATTFQLPGAQEIPLDDTARTEGTFRAWGDESGSQLSPYRFNLEPDLVAPLSDITALRQQAGILLRRSAEAPPQRRPPRRVSGCGD
jgi:hypothetical protein